MSTCNSCHKPIKWALTEKGKRMPVDHEPSFDGNLVFTGKTVKGSPVVHYLRKGETTHQQRFKSHFATCEHAASHRR